MRKNLTEEELEFMEHWHTPKSFVEVMFSDADNLTIWKRNQRLRVRPYQMTMLSSEYLIFPDPKKTEQEIFNMKRRVGAKTVIGGRGYGKTVFERLDIVLTGIHTIWKTAMSAFDQLHVKDVLEQVCRVFEFHPFFKMYYQGIQRSNPNYNIDLKNGFNLQGVNMNIKKKNAGSAWERLHVHKAWFDEEQYETKAVLEKRNESKSELGIIERVHGITSFHRHSPAGQYFDDLKNIKNRVNYPRYINHWTKEDKEKAIERYGGKNSIGYLTNIDGKVVDSAKGLYDMQKIRDTYNDEKVVKEFEISKKEYTVDENNELHWKKNLVLERPKNAEQLYVCADIGRQGTESEIIVVIRIGERYKYLYNITIYQLWEEEQYEVIKFVMEQLKANAIGLDVTDGYGQGIYERLLKVFPAENLFAIAFNEKLEVGFLIDRDERIVVDEETGKEKIRIERVDRWSVNRLQHLFYNLLIEIPQNFKFDVQFDGMREEIGQGGNRNYKSVTDDHLHQAFQVFGIVWFLTERRELDSVEDEDGLGEFTTL